MIVRNLVGLIRYHSLISAERRLLESVSSCKSGVRWFSRSLVLGTSEDNTSFQQADSSASSPIGEIEPHMSASFVCEVCNVRGAWTFKRKTYEKGVVLVRCKSCENLHLVADNLGWFRDSKTNLETLALEKGQTIHRAHNINFRLDTDSWDTSIAPTPPRVENDE